MSAGAETNNLNEQKLEATSAQKSAETHAGKVFVTRDLDLRPSDPSFPGLVVEHLCVKFGDHI